MMFIDGELDYIKGIKIYGIGIKEDPVPGEKRGKGIQHLTSSYWIYDMGVFLQKNMKAIKIMAQVTQFWMCGSHQFLIYLSFCFVFMLAVCV